MPIDVTRFARDDSGAVAVIVALVLTVLLGFVALGVDVASLYRERANLQADSDMAAMSSVIDPAAATARAHHALGRNDRDQNTLAVLTPGRFLRNPEIPPTQRFSPLPAGNPGINAVAVTLEDDAPLHFAKICNNGDHVGLTRKSTAIRTGAASFMLDSHILRLGATDLSAALSESFGTSVSLSAGDIDVLAGATVDAGDLLAELDRLSGSAARNPAAILDEQTDGAGVFTALQPLLPGGAAAILGNLATAAGQTRLPVAALVGGIDSDLGLTAMEFASEIEISALDAVRAVAGVNSFQQQIGLDAAVNVPGIASVSTRLAMGEPPGRSGWIALGEKGVQLHRAAVRLKTEVEVSPDLLGSLGAGISVTEINLPLYVEAAGSTATLEEISCTSSDPQATAARFSTAATPLHPQNGTSVAALYLGTLDDATFSGGPVVPSALGFADILAVELRIGLPLLPDIVIPGITIQARSHVALGASQRESIRFTNADVRAGRTTGHFGSGELLSASLGGLLSPANTEIRVKPGQQGLIGGLAAPLVSTLLAVLPGQLLTTLAGPLDSVIDTTLATAGLRLGEGELTLTGHHCELVRLVQ